MRELHLVGTDPDGALLLAADPEGPAMFRLADLDEVRAATRPATRVSRRVVRRPGGGEPPRTAARPSVRPEPTPAQLQARLRAGASPEALARETGADVERVRRWAAPVQAEMADVLTSALATHVSGDGGQRSPQPLGAVVGASTDELAEGAVDWQVTRRADGRWRVLLRVQAGARVSTANWVWDPRTRSLEAASSRARRLSFPT